MYYLKCTIFSKNLEICKETKYDSYVRKSLEILSKCLHMLDLAAKNIKAMIISMFKKPKKTMFEVLKGK